MTLIKNANTSLHGFEIRGNIESSDLWMPDVKYSWIRGTHDFNATPHVLPVKRDVLATPTDHVVVEASNPEKVGPSTKKKFLCEISSQK